MKKILFIAYGAIAVVALSLVFENPSRVRANPPFFHEKNAEVATTSLSYMTAGGATTTKSFDIFEGGYSTGLNEATLQVIYVASSTSAQLGIRFEDSMDGVDWFPRITPITELATTTNTVGNFNEFAWRFASSTAGSSNGATRIYGSLTVPAPMRYIRAVLYPKIGSSPISIWAHFVGKHEQIF